MTQMRWPRTGSGAWNWTFVRFMQRGRMPAKHGNKQYYKGMQAL